MPFFVFGMWETESGDILFLGNYIDLSYHLSIISSFLEQNVFPPENPQFAGAKMSYHFLVNFHSAILTLGGFSLFFSVLITQILFSFALATMVYHFYKLVLNDEISTFFSASLLIMGHIAFFNFFFAALGHPLTGMDFDIGSWDTIKGHLLYPFFNFQKPIFSFFQPQRPFLFAFPMALIVLSGIYKTFLKKEVDHKLLLGLSLVLGLFPLFHIHTFLILTPILIVASFYMIGNKKQAVLSLLPLALGFVQIFFILSQPKAPGFLGFDVHKVGGGLTDLDILGSAFLTRIVFWIRAAGFPLILGITGFVFYFRKNRLFSLDRGCFLKL